MQSLGSPSVQPTRLSINNQRDPGEGGSVSHDIVHSKSETEVKNHITIFYAKTNVTLCDLHCPDKLSAIPSIYSLYFK